MTATGMLWIEIDFAAAIARANAAVLPRILPATGDRRAAITIEQDMHRGAAQDL